MCMIDDCEVATVLHQRQQKARFTHGCTECRRRIDAGEVYLAERIVSDGSAYSFKVCAHCQAVRGFLSAHCGGWVYQALAEDMHGHYYGDMGNDADAREARLLSVGMSNRWRRQDGSLWPVPRGYSA